MKPFFSIIIPVFKTEEYIQRCIQSCLNQTFKDFEIICIDDCGGDGSIQIVQKYQNLNPKITILYNPTNLGAFHSRARGIQHAQGEYCLFIDSDDFIANDALEILYQTIAKSPTDIIAYRFSYFPKRFFKFSPHLKNSSLTNPEIYQTLNTSTIFQSICNKCIKTSYAKLVANKLSFIHPPFSCCEDGLFFLILSFEVESYQALDQSLYFYQNNPYSTTRSIDQASLDKKILDFKNGLKILQEITQAYPQHTSLILKYREKIISAYILEARKYTKKDLIKILEICDKSTIFTALPFPTYLLSAILSLRAFYRWQSLARIGIYLLTFGKIKL
ncbi:glycosyltransferase family 2 protein [Helicobacter cholecystus]|uniref:Glycosyltransferase family 2 protein n=1 Tax=Helicobacter cholecystus TaxID=45498 RepID=A0A3D8IVJ1_9HELI|nr:glycosyltransferase family 2 protein [Helicobacter cholecystus]RDU68654.1 glycosyltransferase family 2 protein [Helicobacter cholecystus]VEJ24447.1 capsular polysaccharide biosynthsis protein [Helicobacter cholecystus]